MNSYEATNDPAALRRLLLRALDPDVQAIFHGLSAALTPDEWVYREAGLAMEVARIVVPELQQLQQAGRGDWQFPKAEVPYQCPACRAPVPAIKRDGATSAERHPLILHIEGREGFHPCPMVGELLHHLREEVAPTKFLREALEEAKERYETIGRSVSGDAEHRVIRRRKKAP